MGMLETLMTVLAISKKPRITTNFVSKLPKKLRIGLKRDVRVVILEALITI